MSKPPRDLDPYHREIQSLLRFLGPIVLGLGLIFTAIGLISFFSAFGTFEPPRYFWAVFPGFLLIAIGAVMTKLGYLGAILRYWSGEVAPVAGDTFNTLANETREGVQTVAQAVGRGLALATPGTAPEEVPERNIMLCHRCDAPNPANAHYCSHCGTSFKDHACPSCGQTNPAHARFCNSCGKPLA